MPRRASTTKRRPRQLPPPLKLPASIATLPDAMLQRRASEAWRTARRLADVLPVWRDWFGELRSKGDADPGLAYRYWDTAAHCLQTLRGLVPDHPPFNSQSASAVIRSLPAEPSGNIEKDSIEIDNVTVVEKWRSWQHDCLRDGRLMNLDALEGDIRGLLLQLEDAPASVFPAAVSQSSPTATPRKSQTSEFWLPLSEASEQLARIGACPPGLSVLSKWAKAGRFDSRRSETPGCKLDVEYGSLAAYLERRRQEHFDAENAELETDEQPATNEVEKTCQMRLRHAQGN